MNIGLVVPGFSAHADDWCIPALRNLARSLTQRADLRVITVRYPYRAGRYQVDGAQVIALGGAEARGPSSLRLWQRTLVALAAEHRRRRFDVLHAFWATESGLLAALAGRMLGIPTLVSLAGGELVALPSIGYGDQRFPWERLKVRTALHLASAISVGSNSLLTRAQRFVGARTVQKLPLGVDVDRFQPVPRTGQAGLRVLHVGTLTPVKDQATLLRAFALLHQREAAARLTIVGDGPLCAALTGMATEMGIATAVEFDGDVDHGDLPGLYQQADVFVITSRYEAQGMVALEAAACGVRVVGTWVGVVPEIGHAVPVGDAEALASRLNPQPDVHGVLPAEFELHTCTDSFLGAYRAIGA